MTGRYFETLRTYGGEPALLSRHVERLAAAVPNLDPNGVAARVHDAIGSIEQDVVIRIEAGEGDTAIELRPLPAHALEDPATPLATTISEVPGYAYPHKSIDRELHSELIDSAQANGAFEPLIVDHGLVIEGARTNVFVANGSALITPPLGRCLPGVTRGALLATAPVVGLTPTERDVSVDELTRADEVLLSNSLFGVRRVGTIDGRAVGGRSPEVRARLHQALLNSYEHPQ